MNHCEAVSIVEKQGVDDWTYLVMYTLIKLSLFAASFFVFLVWLYQPNVIENPGVGAYQPPPGTRLVPVPRKIEAREIIQIPSADNLAVASVDNNNRSSDSIINKNNTHVAKAKPRQKAIPSYLYGERLAANARQHMSFREWIGSRRNSWFQ
jgi:hypothetical protein